MGWILKDKTHSGIPQLLKLSRRHSGVFFKCCVKYGFQVKTSRVENFQNSFLLEACSDRSSLLSLMRWELIKSKKFWFIQVFSTYDR